MEYQSTESLEDIAAGLVMALELEQQLQPVIEAEAQPLDEAPAEAVLDAETEAILSAMADVIPNDQAEPNLMGLLFLGLCY